MQLTTVMYHYVRPISGSKYPNIKGLEVTEFSNQLDFLIKNYNIVSASEIIASIKGESVLPDNACWLTFDDGYKDNYLYVLDELSKRKLQGSFFLVSEACKGNIILDVNKIHFILDAVKNIGTLIEALKAQIFQMGYSEEEWGKLYAKNAIANRFDDKNTIFFKRMLQRELPQNLRSTVIDNLFNRYVTTDHKEFAQNLYLNESEIDEMFKMGMHFGNHTCNHPWLNSLSYEEQRKEIIDANYYLENIGVISEDWVMCCPYGGYNDDTLKILSDLECGAAVTVNAATTLLPIERKYEISRFDTNDFPK